MSFSGREARSLMRKAVNRVPQGEDISHLNIMPMMDMMTILLVAFIFQASVSATGLTAGQVQLAKSMSDEPLPEGAVTLIITKTNIVVADKGIVALRAGGKVDAADREGGELGIKIPKLSSFLGQLRQIGNADILAKGGTLPDVPELLIIADRTTPYELLIQVMFSAREKEAGYKRFRLIVEKHFVPTK